MKKTVIIGIVVIAAGTLLLLVWVMFSSHSKSSNTQNHPHVQFPSASTSASATTDIMSMTTASGTIAVKNFLADIRTKEDSSNKGYYFLGNQPAAPTPYIIEYLADTQYFNISLLQEPIGQARAQAEAYLLGQLGISKEQLCTLNYMVTTPDSTNSNYSDENLGFSFCPGAVQFPY